MELIMIYGVMTRRTRYMILHAKNNAKPLLFASF